MATRTGTLLGTAFRVVAGGIIATVLPAARPSAAAPPAVVQAGQSRLGGGGPAEPPAPCGPQAQLPGNFSKNVDPKSRCLEIRIYTVDQSRVGTGNSKGDINQLHQRFREKEVALFQKHGAEIIGVWQHLGNPDTLVWMLAYRDRAHREDVSQAQGECGAPVERAEEQVCGSGESEHLHAQRERLFTDEVGARRAWPTAPLERPRRSLVADRGRWRRQKAGDHDQPSALGCRVLIGLASACVRLTAGQSHSCAYKAPWCRRFRSSERCAPPAPRHAAAPVRPDRRSRAATCHWPC